MMKKLFIPFLLVCFYAHASDPYPRNPAIDIEKYVFQLEVTDNNDVLNGIATVTLKIKKNISEFELDLINKKPDGTGMEVESVFWQASRLKFAHQNNRLKIYLSAPAEAYQSITIRITYKGVPQDGLIIGKNKYGDRGFFGDNWPDRGHHWLPVIDHPSDKSAVEFIIIAPMHYSVVANGIKIEESPLDLKRKLTHWREEVPLPVKVMVVGIAQFAVQQSGVINNIPVESWVYPQNRLEGFHDYAYAPKVLDFFITHVGPYPYKKLANVQSKTRWGGLENASAIFYSESSVNGKADRETLIAHEIAHQWFGNSATENDWHHVWLSEGFATYFANLYLENTYGRDRLVEEQLKDREDVISFYKKNQRPVVDSTITDINKVLNTNTYQKAGWVLHMLRQKIGDIAFWNGIRKYYATYQHRNALTGDFVRIMEEVSGEQLNDFFSQWLYQGGHPQVSVTWQFNKKKNTVEVKIDQVQKDGLFSFPLEVALIDKNGQIQLETINIGSKQSYFELTAQFEPVQLKLDPATRILFEANIQKK
jgi:aminopeptidase N